MGRNFSFRILQPPPFLLSTKSNPGPIFSVAVDFHSKTASLAFYHRVKVIPNLFSVHSSLEPVPSVQWSMTLSQMSVLSRAFEKSLTMQKQIQEGVLAYFSQKSWILPGKGAWKYRRNGRTQVMGILNLTPDSFYDGGRYIDPSAAVDQALRMQEEGADWIDLGGESTRPGAKAVSLSEEKKRVLPVLKACAKALRVPLSVDTYKAEMAKAAVEEGARLINDIGALRLDPAMGRILGRLKIPVVLMHMQGRPRTMQKAPRYRDVISDILFFFRERMDFALHCGISQDRILLDPGFGFGKTPVHNMELLKRLHEFRVLGRPLLLGVSRKSTLGHLLGGLPPQQRQEVTDAALCISALQGADFVRVHDVKSAVRVVKIADAIRYGRGLNPR